MIRPRYPSWYVLANFEFRISDAGDTDPAGKSLGAKRGLNFSTQTPVLEVLFRAGFYLRPLFYPQTE